MLKSFKNLYPYRKFSIPLGYVDKNDIWGYPFRPLNPGGINPAKAQAWRSEESILEYTSKDTILYALGIGAGPNKDPCELKYIYENHEDFMVSLEIIHNLVCFLYLTVAPSIENFRPRRVQDDATV